MKALPTCKGTRKCKKTKETSLWVLSKAELLDQSEPCQKWRAVPALQVHTHKSLQAKIFQASGKSRTSAHFSQIKQPVLCGGQASLRTSVADRGVLSPRLELGFIRRLAISTSHCWQFLRVKIVLAHAPKTIDWHLPLKIPAFLLSRLATTYWTHRLESDRINSWRCKWACIKLWNDRLVLHEVTLLSMMKVALLVIHTWRPYTTKRLQNAEVCHSKVHWVTNWCGCAKIAQNG